MIDAISPIDGRYSNKTGDLKNYFSEVALIKYRIKVELTYFNYLGQIGVVKNLNSPINTDEIIENFDISEAQKVKDIEKVTNHDVKAVEYYIKEKLKNSVANDQLEFIHFGLTSQDVNNTAVPMSIKDAINQVIKPTLDDILALLNKKSKEYKTIPMLARTHGQAASPTTLGKELEVFAHRLSIQLNKLSDYHFTAKFGGATGNFNAHKVAYPNIKWPEQMDKYISSLGMKRQAITTQIEHYDGLSELFQIFSRINTLLIDFSRDIWTYISMNYFKQKVIANEVGSSAMPHKVNPIDFENAEGNLSLSIAIFNYLANKLPISRLQRDLTDSTVSRNIGVPFAHLLIALKSLQKGISKLEINEKAINLDLESNWAVVSEGIQTILRREGFEKPYELLKEFSRGKGQLKKEDFELFVSNLDVSDTVKSELNSITPFNYIGYA